MKQAINAVTAYFQGDPTPFSLPFALHGTPFQKQVWQAAIATPYGQTRSYKALAEAIERPTAYRAVANALGRNPLLLLVPCHRIVATDGIGGFSAGLAVKRYLLDLETAHTPTKKGA